MLIGPDDTLWHQLPTTFDHVGTSDPRFFDRYWFAAYDPAGGGALQLTLGVYQNMNVVDGGFVVIVDRHQHNVRTSRSLRPRYETVCEPLRVDVIEPLRHLRLTIDPGRHGVNGRLDWTAILPAQEEIPRFTRVRGRVVEDSRRFDQIGECSGWLDVAGQRLEIEAWWACRDHSWGVRERMGMAEPVTGPRTAPGRDNVFAFLFFSTTAWGGHIQLARSEGRPEYLTAEVAGRGGNGGTLDVVSADLRAEFTDERRPRRFSTAVFDITLEDGTKGTVTARALGPAIAMPGLGYGGYDDGRGLGFWRGDQHVEHDTWDVSSPADVVLGDGSTERPVHRIQPVEVTLEISGTTTQGTGSLTLIAEGEVAPLGVR